MEAICQSSAILWCRTHFGSIWCSQKLPSSCSEAPGSSQEAARKLPESSQEAPKTFQKLPEAGQKLPEAARTCPRAAQRLSFAMIGTCSWELLGSSGSSLGAPAWSCGTSGAISGPAKPLSDVPSKMSWKSRQKSLKIDYKSDPKYTQNLRKMGMRKHL